MTSLLKFACSLNFFTALYAIVPQIYLNYDVIGSRGKILPLATELLSAVLAATAIIIATTTTAVKTAVIIEINYQLKKVIIKKLNNTLP